MNTFANPCNMAAMVDVATPRQQRKGEHKNEIYVNTKIYAGTFMMLSGK